MNATENSIWQAFLSYVVPFLLTSLSAVAIAALGKLAQWLHVKAQTSKVWSAIDLASGYADAAVASVLTLMTAEYKAKAADGTLSADDALKLKADAFTVVKTKLTQAGINFLDYQLKGSGVTAEAQLQSSISTSVAKLSGIDPGTPSPK